jgi:hypothetical protein
LIPNSGMISSRVHHQEYVPKVSHSLPISLTLVSMIIPSSQLSQDEARNRRKYLSTEKIDDSSSDQEEGESDPGM